MNIIILFNFRCKGINISRSIQIFGQINALSLHIFIYYVHEKGQKYEKYRNFGFG